MPYSRQGPTTSHTCFTLALDEQVLDEVPDLEDDDDSTCVTTIFPQVLDEVPHLEDDDEELPDADAELRDMAARHEAFRASEQAARANMEGGCSGGRAECGHERASEEQPMGLGGYWVASRGGGGPEARAKAGAYVGVWRAGRVGAGGTAREAWTYAGASGGGRFPRY